MIRAITVMVAAAVAAGCGETDTIWTTSSSSSSSSSGTISMTGSGGTGGHGGTTSSSTSSSVSSGSTGGTGGGPECSSPVTCPGADTECTSRTCVGGKCGVSHQASGYVISAQTPGDCTDVVCDGNGGTKSQANAVDVPAGNECNAGVCAPGPMLTPKATGTACTTGGGHLCQNGSCVAYIPVKCKVGSTVYTGCDGFTHPGLSMSYVGSGPGICKGSPSDNGYCPPGNSCAVTVNGQPELGQCQ